MIGAPFGGDTLGSRKAGAMTTPSVGSKSLWRSLVRCSSEEIADTTFGIVQAHVVHSFLDASKCYIGAVAFLSAGVAAAGLRTLRHHPLLPYGL